MNQDCLRERQDGSTYQIDLGFEADLVLSPARDAVTGWAISRRAGKVFDVKTVTQTTSSEELHCRSSEVLRRILNRHSSGPVSDRATKAWLVVEHLTMLVPNGSMSEPGSNRHS